MLYLYIIFFNGESHITFFCIEIEDCYQQIAQSL